MARIARRELLALSAVPAAASFARTDESEEADIVVYGGVPCGIAAAVTAAETGVSVLYGAAVERVDKTGPRLDRVRLSDGWDSLRPAGPEGSHGGRGGQPASRSQRFGEGLHRR